MKRVSHVLNYKGSYYDIDHYYINQFGYNNFFILYATINKTKFYNIKKDTLICYKNCYNDCNERACYYHTRLNIYAILDHSNKYIPKEVTFTII